MAINVKKNIKNQDVNCSKLVHGPVKKFVDDNVLIHLKIVKSKLPKFYLCIIKGNYMIN